MSYQIAWPMTIFSLGKGLSVVLYNTTTGEASASRGNNAFLKICQETCFFKIQFLGRTLPLHCSTLRVSKEWHHFKTWPYGQIPTNAPYAKTSIKWFRSDNPQSPLLRDQSCQLKSLMYSTYKEVLRKWYCSAKMTTLPAWGVPGRVPSSVSSWILHSDLASWALTLSTLKIKMTTKRNAAQSAPTNECHAHCTSKQ